MVIHVAEPGRPLGTRLPEAFRARRVADRGQPDPINASVGNAEQPVDPTRFRTDYPSNARRALQEYQEESSDQPESEIPYLPSARLASRKILSIEASQELRAALTRMDENSVHHLVVTSVQGDVAGLIDREWVLEALWQQGGASKSLMDIELPAFVTVTPETDAHQLAQQMLAYQLSAALVIDQNNQPTGVITSSDFLRLYAESSPLHTTI